MDQASRDTRGSAAAVVFRIAMAAGLLLGLAANLPGHMSLDSVVTLTEARTGVRQTWAPAVSSWILRPFDAVVSGTGLYVAACAALLFLSLMSLPRLRGRATWLAAGLGVLAIATPQVLIYQGIVWRDVLFANLTIAGFICLAHAVRRWDSRPVLPLAGALACLALAALVRQNGLILVVAAAGALAWTARRGGLRASLAWGGGSLVAVAVLALAFNHLAQPPKTVAKLRLNTPALILEHYDIVGAKAHHPKLKFKEIGKVDRAAQALLEAQSQRIYSATRVDTLDSDEAFRKTIWHVPDAAMNAQWRAVILHYPAGYLLHRADVFRWVFLTPKLELCLPVQVGVIGPAEMVDDLNLQPGIDTRAQAVADYARKFYGTPVYSHLTWALVAVAAIVLLLRRRDPADWVIMAMLGGALAFVASFALISLACDYRYLYLLDLAAIVGALYVALDPPRRRRALPPPMTSSRAR